VDGGKAVGRGAVCGDVDGAPDVQGCCINVDVANGVTALRGPALR
jgi:hypothetical protein